MSNVNPILPPIQTQIADNAPVPVGLVSVTSPLVASQQTLFRLRNFPPQTYSLAPDSHLFRLMNVLLGETAGAQLRKRGLVNRLRETMAGTHFLDLDGFWGALFGLRRTSSELLSTNPYTDTNSISDWQDQHAADASYRDRIYQFARAIGYGSSLAGLKLVSEAVLSTQCEIFTHASDDSSLSTMAQSLRSYVITIAPHTNITIEQQFELKNILDQIRSANSLVQIQTTGIQIQTPVPLLGGYADSYYWEVDYNTTGSQYSSPNKQQFAFGSTQGDYWTVNGFITNTLSYVQDIVGNLLLSSDDQLVSWADGSSTIYASRKALTPSIEAQLGYLAQPGVTQANPINAASGPSDVLMGGVNISQLPTDAATTNNDGQQFWSTFPRMNVDTSQEFIELRLSEPHLINNISFQVAHFPHNFFCQYYDVTKAAWITLYTQSIAGSAPYVIPSSQDALASHVHPQHFGPGHWQQISFRFSPLTVSSLRINCVRFVGDGPYDLSGDPVPYSLGIQNFIATYMVDSIDMLPVGQSDIDTSLDIFGNRLNYTVYQELPSGPVYGTGQWRCEPQPSNNSVVNYYVDGRDENIVPQVIDMFYIQPTSLGVHCFAGETKYLTHDGKKTFAETVGTSQLVLTNLGYGGHWVEADIHSFGEQRIWELTLRRNKITKTIRTTDGHRWMVHTQREKKGQTNHIVETSNLKSGSWLSSLLPRNNIRMSTPSPFGITHGIVFGDGTKNGQEKGCTINLWGAKDAQLLKYFSACRQSLVKTPNGVEGVHIKDIPNHFKNFPDLNESVGYLYGWLAGYFAADGTVGSLGQASITSAIKSHLEFVERLCLRLGIATYGIRESVSRSGFIEDAISYRITFVNSTLRSEFFLIRSHQDRYEGCIERGNPERIGWTVVSAKETDDVEEVFCAVVPGTESFVLEDYIHTKNCTLYYTHDVPNGTGTSLNDNIQGATVVGVVTDQVSGMQFAATGNSYISLPSLGIRLPSLDWWAGISFQMGYNLVTPLMTIGGATISVQGKTLIFQDSVNQTVSIPFNVMPNATANVVIGWIAGTTTTMLVEQTTGEPIVDGGNPVSFDSTTGSDVLDGGDTPNTVESIVTDGGFPGSNVTSGTIQTSVTAYGGTYYLAYQSGTQTQQTTASLATLNDWGGSSVTIGGYAGQTSGITLMGFVLKSETLTPDTITNFLNNPIDYCDKGIFPGQSVDLTDSAYVRFNPRFISNENPTGCVGGTPDVMSNLLWYPLKSFIMTKGFMQFPAVAATFYKFELTNLVAQPMTSFVPITKTTNFFADVPRTSTIAYQGPIPPGYATQQAIGTGEIPFAADTPIFATEPDPRNYYPTETLVAINPSVAQALATQYPAQFNYLAWHQGYEAAQSIVPGLESYPQTEVSQTAQIGFMAGFVSIAAFRSSPAASTDTSIYEEYFLDDVGFSGSGLTLVPGDLSTLSAAIPYVSQPLANPIIAQSISYPSLDTVVGLNFATVQTDPVQLIYDDQFISAQYINYDWSDLSIWHTVGDAQASYNAKNNDVILARNVVSSSGGIPHSLIRSVSSPVQAESAIEGAQNIGGLESSVFITSLAGRIYVAIALLPLTNLTSPLLVQLIDSNVGVVVSEWSITGPANQLIQEYFSYDIGSLVSATTPFRVRVLQQGNSSDSWLVSAFSVFDEAIVWSFSNDGGISWTEALGIKNNLYGVMTFLSDDIIPPDLLPPTDITTVTPVFPATPVAPTAPTTPPVTPVTPTPPPPPTAPVVPSTIGIWDQSQWDTSTWL
jgi:hypothetical protein